MAGVVREMKTWVMDQKAGIAHGLPIYQADISLKGHGRERKLEANQLLLPDSARLVVSSLCLCVVHPTEKLQKFG